MEPGDLVARIRFLADQVAQAEERTDHLKTRMPLGVEAASLNYREDLVRIKGEYNAAVARALAAGLLSRAHLEAMGLPLQMPD